MRISLQQGDRWTPVAEVPVPNRNLLPGIEVEFVTDLQRRLPGGTYRLEGNVTGGGRRLAALEQTVTLAGGPATAPVAVDVPLKFAPQTVVKVSPGGTSSATVTIGNPSAESLEVTVALARPGVLSGANLPASTAGPQDASGWLEVTPATFTLRAFAQQNLRVLATVPAAQAPVANSYAVLRVAARHTDGESASESQGLLIVRDPRLAAKAAAEAVSLELNHQEGNKYSVTARFVNTGNVEWAPTCQARVAPAVGPDVASTPLETESKVVLPTATCIFSGVLDFSSVKAGAYVLHATLTYAQQDLARELPLQVEIDANGNRTVSVIGSEAAPAAVPNP
jgi:hypothetical protein